MAKHNKPEEQTGGGHSTATLEPPPHAMHNPFHHQHQQQQDAPPEPPPLPSEQAAPPQPTQAVWTPPKPLGKTPTGVASLGANATFGTKATHFSGPLVSGGIPQQALQRKAGTPAAIAPVGGSAVLTATFIIDYTMGNFTVPVQFPPGSLITGVGSATLTSFTAPPSAALGKTSGAADIVAATPLPAENAPLTFSPATGQLPLWDAVSPQTPFEAFLTVSANTGGTKGFGVILIQFVRIPQKWS